MWSFFLFWFWEILSSVSSLWWSKLRSKLTNQKSLRTTIITMWQNGFWSFRLRLKPIAGPTKISWRVTGLSPYWFRVLFCNKREEYERPHKRTISLRRAKKILLDKYARKVVEEVAMQKVLSKKWKTGDKVSSYFRNYSKLFDDAGVFDEQMQCFHMKHGLRDWKDWQDKLSYSRPRSFPNYVPRCRLLLLSTRRRRRSVQRYPRSQKWQCAVCWYLRCRKIGYRSMQWISLGPRDLQMWCEKTHFDILSSSLQ